MTTRERDVVRCPVRSCHTTLIATHPMRTEIRYDRAMQNLVDKLLPQFAKADEELKRKLELQYGGAKRSAPTPAAASAEPPAKKHKFGDDKLSVGRAAPRGARLGCGFGGRAEGQRRAGLERLHVYATAHANTVPIAFVACSGFLRLSSGHEKLMIFELRPYVAPTSASAGASAASATPLPPLALPFVKTSAKVTVKHLRKFVVERLGLPAGTGLDLQCSGEVLGHDHSVEFIWRTRWHHLHPNQHLVLTYRAQSHHL